MNTITITLRSQEHTESLAEMLSSLDFVESVNVYEEDEDELTPEENQMVEERMEHYRKNPHTAKSWDEIRLNIQKKYGF